MRALALIGPFSRSHAAVALLAGAALLADGCAAGRPLNPVSAGTLAARLANERCQRVYGARPFAPDDFEAVREKDGWQWGTATGGKVDGYEVKVSFDERGGKRNVEVRIPPE
jgi:hypothetical protein